MSKKMFDSFEARLSPNFSKNPPYLKINGEELLCVTRMNFDLDSDGGFPTIRLDLEITDDCRVTGEGVIELGKVRILSDIAARQMYEALKLRFESASEGSILDGMREL